MFHDATPSRIFPRANGKPAEEDPARRIPGMPPNFGAEVLPHVYTFQGIYSNIARTYLISDEAMRASMENARYMRNDCRVMECLETRQRSAALLDWHLEVDDEKDATQKRLKDDLTKILQATRPGLLRFKKTLLEALWYGKYGVASRFRWKRIAGATPANDAGQVVAIDSWRPVNGDKIVYRHDDPRLFHAGELGYPGQVGIRVGLAFAHAGTIPSRFRPEEISQEKVQVTDWGWAYFLNPDERNLIAVHKHEIEDAEFEMPELAGRIHGVGIRSRIYWMWSLAQEMLGSMVDYIDRSAFGFEIWYYNAANPESYQKTKKAAQERLGQGKNIILCPVEPDSPLLNHLVQRIEPGMAGVESLRGILQEFFGWAIKRYILGQVATTEPISAGIGGTLPSVHLDTYLQIVRYDCVNLSETISDEVVRPLQLFNYPGLAQIPVRFVIETESPDVESRLNAMYKAWAMGARIPAKEVYQTCSIRPPEEDDEVLQNRQPEERQRPWGSDEESDREPDGQGGRKVFPSAWPQEGNVVTQLQQRLAKQERFIRRVAIRVERDQRRSAERYARIEARTALDRAAAETDVAPTADQREAGNYRKGKCRLFGLEITIETPKSGVRRGVDRDGKEWSVRMPYHYGYIRRTESEADGDHVDVFLGPDLDSEFVLVIDQVDPRTDQFDEHKVMLGWSNAERAQQAYLAAYQPNWKGLGAVTPMTLPQFHRWLETGKTDRPLAGQVTERYARQAQPGEIITREWLERARAEVAAFATGNMLGFPHEIAPGIQGRYLGLVNGHDVYAADFEAAEFGAEPGADPDIVVGANHQRWPIVPENHLWVDWNLAPKDWAHVVLHEATEEKLMRELGWSYDRAHEYANRLETQFARDTLGGLFPGRVASPPRREAYAADQGPREGDEKVQNGQRLVFHGSRWHSAENVSAKAAGPPQAPLRELPHLVYQDADPARLVACRARSTRPQFMKPLSEEQLRDMLAKGGVARLSDDGTSGYVLTGEGDLHNVFNAGGPRGAGTAALIEASSRGATTLDCIGRGLAVIYSRVGFVAYRAERWDDKLAPSGWDYEQDDRPDVFYMRYEGKSRDPEQIRADYGKHAAFKHPGYKPLG
jgi:hypothetical protein